MVIKELKIQLLESKQPVELLISFKREKSINMKLAIWQLITDKTAIGNNIKIYIQKVKE